MENLFFLVLGFSFAKVLGLSIGIIIGILVLLLLLCYFILAPQKKFLSLGIENRAEFIMEGKKFSGKVILPSQTNGVYNNYDIIDLNNPPLGFDKKNLRVQKSFLGMYWIGIYPFYSIYERHQQWLEWESTEDGRKIRFRDVITPYLFIKPFEYAMLLRGAEDKNLVPLNVYFTIIVRPTNVRLPIFGNDDAYGQLQTQCLTQALLFVREETFLSLGGENLSPTDLKNDLFSSQICKINDSIPGRPDKLGTKVVLGYEILDAKLDAIEITGDKKERLLEASVVEYIAKENAKAKIAEAEGNMESNFREAKGQEAKLNVQKKYLKDVSEIPGAMKVEERRATPGLTTLVEADSDKKTSLLIGGR